MNLLSLYLCSEENVFFWKSQNSCNGIFLLTWSRLFSNHDSNYVDICRVPLWIKRVVFPIHVNFSITSRCILKATFSITSWCVLKATIQSKKQWTVLSYLRQFFFFQKDAFMILYMHVLYSNNFSILSQSVPISHVSIIFNYFCHITF